MRKWIGKTLYKIFCHPPYGHVIELHRAGILATACSVLSPEVDESMIQLPSLLYRCSVSPLEV